jgi:hypothetical protein
LKDLAREFCPAYHAVCKKEKRDIAVMVVEHVHKMRPHGRFLSHGLQGWQEVPEAVAREKASQCLRDCVSAIQKESKWRLESMIPHPKATSYPSNANENSRKQELVTDIPAQDPVDNDLVVACCHQVVCKPRKRSGDIAVYSTGQHDHNTAESPLKRVCPNENWTESSNISLAELAMFSPLLWTSGNIEGEEVAADNLLFSIQPVCCNSNGNSLSFDADFRRMLSSLLQDL